MEYSYDSRCLYRDGNPWFPVMGEMHYSRYRADLWEESLRKMKAGGVEIVSTYLIWIHHEEEEGVFDFSGSKDIRRFVKLCKKYGLYVTGGSDFHGEKNKPDHPLAALELDIDWLT